VYITLTLFTKRLLTWNLALVYFVTTLDLLPALYQRRRRNPAITAGPGT
jgi:hypothetical protein